MYFMQAGFALCEAGFTRAKNTGNILMKNMMDFCIGTPCYWLIGFGLMFGGTGALIGGFDPFIQGDWQLIRNRISLGCTSCSAPRSALRQPPSSPAPWPNAPTSRPTACTPPPSRWWCIPSAATGCGAAAGCRAWASTILQVPQPCIMWAASSPCWALGCWVPVLAYDKDGNPHAIPGHNLTAGALGVFILWFCWFGFNGGSSRACPPMPLMTPTGLGPGFNTNPCRSRCYLRNGDLHLLRYGALMSP